jgi:GMP synthase (glutamine-hydrolysing)
LDRFPDSEEDAGRLINRVAGINRVVVAVWTAAPLEDLRAIPATLTAVRLDRLRRADAIVRRITNDRGFDAVIWQFPVVLIPLGVNDGTGWPDSVVLRPIQSVDGMTANAVQMPGELLTEIVGELREMGDIAGVFYDLTHKPPGTIEWE